VVTNRRQQNKGIPNKEYCIRNKEVEFVPAFDNFNAYNIFIAHGFNRGRGRIKCKKITPIASRKIQIQTLFSF
jgi:hypothetical protein